jgi:hypothetical protein
MRPNNRRPLVFVFPISGIEHPIGKSTIVCIAFSPADEQVMQIQVVPPLTKISKRNQLKGRYSVRSKRPIKQSTE